MKKLECAYEEAAMQIDAAAQTDELQTHIAACDICTDAVRVMQFMRGLGAANEPAMAAALPQAAHLWWKAQMLEQQSAEERATLPILIVQVASYLVITLGFIGALLWKLPQLQARLASLPQLAWLQQGRALSPASTSLSAQLATLLFILLCLAVVWTFRAVLAED